MTAPRCDMWLGRCPNTAKWIVTAHVPTGERHTPLTWLTCADGGCRQMAQMHMQAFGLHHFASRRLTSAELAALTKQEVAA